MKQTDPNAPIPLRDYVTIIHSSQDQYGRILVFDDGGYRILNFDSPFEQSCMNLSHPVQLAHQYTRFMLLVLAYIEPQHISIFGLGGGSLLRTLHHILPSCEFDVVELRKKVVGIATDYFKIPVDHRVKITVNDALTEVSTMESNSSDIIFSDMYDAYRMVQEQSHEEFLRHCSRVLTPRGWLVLNMHRLPQDREKFFQRIGSVFPTVMMSADQDNTVVMASNGFSDGIQSSSETIESIERKLHQKFSQLIPRLKPINFRFQP